MKQISLNFVSQQSNNEFQLKRKLCNQERDSNFSFSTKKNISIGSTQFIELFSCIFSRMF